MTGSPTPRGQDLRYWLASHRGPMLAAALFAAMFAVFGTQHPAGFSADIINTAANKGVLLALIAIAQTLPVLTSGLDLSVGSVFVMTNCVASTVMTGTPLEVGLGVALVLAVGVACGALNGVVVVFGRLQPIIATLATGAMYHGVALWLRPAPGGEIDERFAELMTSSLGDVVPVSLVVLAVVVGAVWIPYRRSVLGRAAYAIGSSEHAAYVSGVPVARGKLVAYVLAGSLAAVAGLLLTCVTMSGEANAALGGSYTLSSIAAVVIGGTSLAGGSGTAIASIFGAFVLRTIGDLLFVFEIDPLLQQLFLGVVLLVAVSLGAFRLLQVKNRLEFYR